ncbi:MAG: hypothetical protein HND47_16070 [Chloroflexi bacterium]|nr:hypothetical protein [Chloroflexota bacterium]
MMGLDLTHPFNNGAMNMYACGLEMAERGGKKVWTHSGGAGGFRTEMIYVPGPAWRWVCFPTTVRWTRSHWAEKSRRWCLPELAPRGAQIAGAPILEASEKEMHELAGCYRMPDGLLSTVVIAEHKLFIHTPYYPFRLPLLKIGAGHYKIDILGAELQVEYDQAGKLCAVSSLTPIGPHAR